MGNGELKRYENMIDGLRYPVWLRDENLKLIAVNKKYVEYCGQNSKENVIRDNIELCNNNGEAVVKRVAADVQKSKKNKHCNFHMVLSGKLYHFEAWETPYFIENDLDKTGTVGSLTDCTELEDVKRNFKLKERLLPFLMISSVCFSITMLSAICGDWIPSFWNQTRRI